MTTTTPTDHELMTAAMAASIRQTFTGLLAMPARLGDIELTSAAAADEPAGPAEPADVPPTIAVLPIGPMAGQTPAVRRQRSARRAIVRPAMVRAVSADDLF